MYEKTSKNTCTRYVSFQRASLVRHRSGWFVVLVLSTRLLIIFRNENGISTSTPLWKQVTKYYGSDQLVHCRFKDNRRCGVYMPAKEGTCISICPSLTTDITQPTYAAWKLKRRERKKIKPSPKCVVTATSPRNIFAPARLFQAVLT